MRRSRITLLLALGGAMTAAALVHCKSEQIKTVDLTLGVDNSGSQGFACSEERPPVCQAFLECQLPGRERSAECIQAYCRDAGSPRACGELLDCARFADAGAATCYEKVCPPTPPLLSPASDDGSTFSLHLIVEYVRLGGFPGCRVAELSAWCNAHPDACRPVRRTCIPITFTAPPGAAPAELSRRVAEGLAERRTIDDDAPSEPVVVRIVGVAKSGACDASEQDPAAPYAGALVGCAYSCPVVLTSVEGDVLVDVDVVKETCSRGLVDLCASLYVDGGAP
jgi:hypothetical protein